MDILNSHQAIAWDFDGTLYGHKKSPDMHRYILAHPEKRHVIVTFRTHGLQHSVFEELEDYQGAPGERDFEKVLNIEDVSWEKFSIAQQQRQRWTGRDNWHTAFENQDLVYAERAYLEWKGRMCHEHGLTVLVDDMTDRVIDGCTKYGITFVNPDDL